MAGSYPTYPFVPITRYDARMDYVCRHGKLSREHGCDDHRDHAASQAEARWTEYWESLTPAQRAAELRMMDQHVLERERM